MKIKRKEIDSSGNGFIILIPEENEDFWHIYNLISLGDKIRTSTFRRINQETVTGSIKTKDRKKLTLTIEIKSVEFNPEDGELRLSGTNVEENEYVKFGQYHTLTLELHKQFTLSKPEWDEISLDRIREACDASNRAEVAALLVTEGLGNLCLVTESMTILKAHITSSIPRKKKGATTRHDQGVEKFFDTLYDIVKRDVVFDVVKCLIIGGPGFTKDQFYNHLLKTAVAREDKIILENKSKILVVGTTSAHKHALKEVFMDKEILEKMSDTKAAKEVKALNEFYQALQNDPDRATYGLKPTLKANLQGAIDCLMVSDTLFRAQKVATRKQYISLVDSVKEQGGTVLIFSSLHMSGVQLDQFGGIAAILRFPVADIDDYDDDDEEKDEKDEKDEKNEKDEDEDEENYEKEDKKEKQEKEEKKEKN